MEAVTEWIKSHWKIILETINYYRSLEVIFYTEIALISFCIIDLIFNVTQLGLLLSVSNSPAYTHASVSRASYYPNYIFWNELYTLVTTFYLIESVIRIYYLLRLAYYHSHKVKNGDLCCMTCHSALVSAAMTNEVVVPHLLSSLTLIVYFIYSKVVVSSETVELLQDYFAESPFVKVNGSIANHTIKESMFFQMGLKVISILKDCRLNTTVSENTSVSLLLHTGQLLSVVDHSCSKMAAHCKFSRYYLQLSIESIQATINYTVIRALFGHIISLHQYEVYNQQTRILTGAGSSRLIRVYKMHHSRAHMKSYAKMKKLPRNGLTSLVYLGTNVASRFRNPRVDLHQHANLMTQDDWCGPEKDEALQGWLINYARPESVLPDANQTESGAVRSTETGDTKQISGQIKADQELQWKRPPRRVSYEYVKLSNLCPLNTVDDPAQQQQQQQQQQQNKQTARDSTSAAIAESQAEDQHQQQRRKQRDEKPLDQWLPMPVSLETTATDDVTASEDSQQSRYRKKGNNKRVNSSIFTDESFYSV